MRVDSLETSLSDYMRFGSPDLFTKAIRFQDFLTDGKTRDIEKYLHQYVEYRGGAARVRDRHTGRIHDVQIYCSADYLDLARRAEVIGAARQALEQFGTSVSSVPLIAGATVIHDELERELARFVGTESCVLFPTGHAANVSTIAALCSANDVVLVDKQVHASVVEGVKLANASWRTFRHSDTEHLESVLWGLRSRRSQSGILVVVEGVYGLDGDIAPLQQIRDITRTYGARLMLDDAHATGVIGPDGAGTASHFGMSALPDIIMGSFSKALGVLAGLSLLIRALLISFDSLRAP